MSARRTRFTNVREPFPRVCAITSRNTSSTTNVFFEVHRVSLICHKSSPKSALDVIMNALICHPLIASPRGPFPLPVGPCASKLKNDKKQGHYILFRSIIRTQAHPSASSRLLLRVVISTLLVSIMMCCESSILPPSNPMRLFMDCLPRGMFLVMSYIGLFGVS
jgi:hypothetical protein